MRYAEALAFGRTMLKNHTCPGSNADRESLELLSLASGAPSEELLSRPDEPLSERSTDAYARFVQRRLRHEPLALIIGEMPFLGRSYRVTGDTLIPRPATEAITDIAARAFASSDASLAVDVGTGCGCIAISLAGAKPQAKVVATDVSPRALEVARDNARRLGMDAGPDFRAGDLLAPAAGDLADAASSIIVANLPYIPTDSVELLPPDVRSFEPPIALDGGGDGLDLYRRMLIQIGVFAPGKESRIFVEIMPYQFAPLFEEIGERFPGSEVADISHSGTIIGLTALLRTPAPS